MRLRRVRWLLVFALLAAGLMNVHALVLDLRVHSRFRDSVSASLRERVATARADMAPMFAAGGSQVEAAVRRAHGGGTWLSVEALTVEGRTIAAAPEPASPARWLTARELSALRSGSVLVGAPRGGGGDRLTAYAMMTGVDGPAVLRFEAASPELAEDVREQQQRVLGHAANLLVLLLVGSVIAIMEPHPSEPAAPPRALLAYEQAMERLRDQDEQRTERHAEERRHLEGIVRDKEAMASAGELTAGIVHEVRNGLGTIVGYARMIENRAADSADAARGIREECETLEQVIRRFMDFVKRETLDLQRVDLGSVLGRVAARETRREGAAVAVDAGPVILRADEALIERVFENLVRNAREAAGAAGRVWVTAARAGGEVAVTVSDDGPGLSPATRASLRPFFTTRVGGLGLGLAIALKIVRLHGGRLTIGDRAPRGAAVTVTLPADGPAGTRAPGGVA
jgi:signal transduction histidine kinase